MLRVNDIHTYYGKSHILQGVSLDVQKGEIVALLGRNGVGKSTTLKSIMGLNPPKKGSIHFQGDTDIDITFLPPYKTAQLGISYVPEDRRIFTHLSTLENLRTGLDLVHRTKESKNEAIDRVFDYFPQLRERIHQAGRTLSGGEQQMLAIARVMVTKPKLVLMDEPSEGLMPFLVEEIKKAISRMRDEDVAILLVEQNAHMALEVSDRVYIMEKGVIRYQGEARELAAQEHTLRELLGVS